MALQTEQEKNEKAVADFLAIAQSKGYNSVQTQQFLYNNADNIKRGYGDKRGNEIVSLIQSKIQAPERGLWQTVQDQWQSALGAVDAMQQPFMDFFDPSSDWAKENRAERQEHLNNVSEAQQLRNLQAQHNLAQAQANGDWGIAARIQNIASDPFVQTADLAAQALPAAGLLGATYLSGGTLAPATVPALFGMGFVQGAGGARGDLYEATIAQDDQVLQNHNAEYRQLRQSGMSEAEAKNIVGTNIQEHLGELAGAAVSGAVLERFGLGKALRGQGSALRNLAGEIISEAADEGVQTALANNMKTAVNPNQSLWENVPLAMFDGALMGGMSGALAATLSPKNSTTAPVADTTDQILQAAEQAQSARFLQNQAAEQAQMLALPAPETRLELPTQQNVHLNQSIGQAFNELSARQNGETKTAYEKRIKQLEANFGTFSDTFIQEMQNGQTKWDTTTPYGTFAQRSYDLTQSHDYSAQNAKMGDTTQSNEARKAWAEALRETKTKPIPDYRPEVMYMGNARPIQAEPFNPALPAPYEQTAALPTPENIAIHQSLAKNLNQLAERKKGETRAEWLKRIEKIDEKQAAFEKRFLNDWHNGHLQNIFNATNNKKTKADEQEYRAFARAVMSLQPHVDIEPSQNILLSEQQEAEQPPTHTHPTKSNNQDLINALIRAGLKFEPSQVNTQTKPIKPSTLQQAAQATTSTGKVATGEQASVDIGKDTQAVTWEIREASDLGASIDKAQNQFRDRTRAASQAQIQQIAQKPDYRYLNNSPVMDYGAPTLAQDGSTIIGGNGRTAGLKQAYTQGTAEQYRADLIANAQQYGFTPEQIAEFEQPVLVRRLNNQVDIEQAAIASNEGGGLVMSALEQAKADATRLPPLDMFTFSETGSLNTGANSKAIQQWVKQFPQNQQAALQDGQGKLSQTGENRLQNAILYQAYGDSPTLARQIESTSIESRNIANALTQSASTVAQAKTEITYGNLHDLDIADDLTEAADIMEQLRAQGASISDWLAQEHLITEIAPSPEARILVKYFNDHIRSAKAMRDLITAYYDEVQNLGNPNQADMFGDNIVPTKTELLSKVIQNHENNTTNQSENPSERAEQSRDVAPVVQPETQSPVRAGIGQSDTESRANAEVNDFRQPENAEAVSSNRAQYDQAKATGKTELTFAQWQQVRTPEFKAWFGDWENDPENASKVINPRTGEPLVVYHGTGSDFSEFTDMPKRDEGWYGKGHYFTELPDVAEYYATRVFTKSSSNTTPNLMPVYLNIRNPFKQREYDSSVEVDENGDVIENPRNKGLLMGNELDRYLIENNHDGVMILEMLNPYKHENIIGDKYIELMVKNSTQIKSAIGNNGQFDSNNPDIRFSRTNATQAKYEQRIDDIFAGKTFRDQVRVLDRSDLLDMLGYGNQEVVLVNSKVNAEKHGNMTAEQWKKVPEWLDNPSMVFHSDTVAGRLVFIAPESVENNPVKIILEPKGGKLEAHVLLNAYDMSVDEESKVNHSNPFTTFAHWRDTDKLLYIDKEKTSRLASRLGLLLPQRLLQPTGRGRILTERNLQGYRKNTPFDENQTRNSQSPNPVSDRATATKIAAYQTAISGSLKNHAHLINVVSREDLVRPENAEQLADVEGFYNPKDGSITLIAESLRSPAHAQFVAWHELAHRKIHVSQAQEWHSAIAQAAKHETVRKLADKIQEYRKNTDDPAATNRAVAHEEAIAELYAAHETGDYATLKEKYKIQIPRVIQNNLGGFLARLGDKLANIVKRALGLNVDNHADVFELLHNLQQLNVSGSLNEAETRTQYSRENNNETVIEQAGKRLARIAQAIQNGAKYISNEPIHLGSTPDVLVRLGVPQRPMRIVDTKKLFQTAGRRNQDDHGLTPDVLGEFPKAMQNPLAVFDSATQENAKVLVVELKDSQDRPIIAAIHIDERQGFNQINKIASIYGRNNAEGTFNRWTDDGLLRYLNDEKSHSVLTSFGLQLPTEKSMNGMVDNVLLASEFVNSASLKFSRGTSKDQIAQFAQTGKIEQDLGLIEAVRTDQTADYLAGKKTAMGKVRDFLVEGFADNLIKVSDWIDGLPIAEMQRELFKQSMYRAGGMRDYQNQIITEQFIQPMNKELARIAKKTKRPMIEVKRLVGVWGSANYAPTANARLLQRAKAELDQAKADGASQAKIDELQAAYNERQAAINGTADGKTAGGYSNPFAAEVKANIEKHLDVADIKAVMKHVHAMLQYKLDLDLKAGRISQEMYNDFKANKEYVPLTGDPISELQDENDFIGHSTDINQSRDKQMGGRSSMAEDAIDAAFGAIGKSTAIHGWSEFKNRLNDIYETAYNDQIQAGKSPEAAAKAVEKEYGITREKMQGTTRPSDKVIIHQQGGQYYEFRLNDKLTAALHAHNTEAMNAFLRPIATVTRGYARLVTQFTPSFAPVNAVRDMWEKSEMIRTFKAWDSNGNRVNMNKVAKSAIAQSLTPSTIKQTIQAAWRNDYSGEMGQHLREFLAHGGVSTQGTMLSPTEQDLLKQIKKETGMGNIPLRKVFQYVESYNTMFDLVPSFSLYMAMRKHGISAEQAAGLALDTTNFRKKGKYMGGIKAIYMFAQPIATGAYNLARFLNTRTGQIRAVKYIAIGIILYSILREWADDDEGGNQLDQMGDITRYIPIPSPFEKGKYIKIPVGFGLPQFAWNIATNSVKAAHGDISIGEAMGEIGTHWAKTIAPIAPSEVPVTEYPATKAVLTFTPSIFQPIVQNALNRNAFGTPIAPAFVNDKKLKAEQSKTTTAQEWRDMALWLQRNLDVDMHPEQIRNIVSGYAGGFLRDIVNITIENPNAEQLGKAPKTPFINALYGAGNEYAIQNRYFAAMDEAKKLQQEYESRQKNGDLGDWLTDERRKKLDWYKRASRAEQRVSTQKSRATRQYNKGTMSDEAYRAKTAETIQKRLAYQKPLLNQWRRMENKPTSE